MLLHGWGGNMTSFLDLEHRLNRHARVLNLDFYGFGDSPAPSAPIDVPDYAEGVLELIYKYSMTDVVLIGHSFGGRVALYIAENYPDLVSGLVLIDSAGIFPRFNPRRFIKLTLHRILKKLGLNGLQGSADYRVLDDISKATFNNIVSYDLESRLDRISCPTLLIWGKEDSDTPLYMAKKLNRNIKDSELITFNGAGHFSYLDKPYETFLIVRSFIDAI